VKELFASFAIAEHVITPKLVATQTALAVPAEDIDFLLCSSTDHHEP
jgi:hypothetical protein